MKTSRKEKRYNKVVYKIDDTYSILEYLFKDGNFMGATGTVVEIITGEEIKYLEDNWDGEENWKLSVEAEGTILGLSEWEDSVRNAGECHVWEKYTELVHGIKLEENEFLNVLSCGRCFDIKEMQEGSHEIIRNAKGIFNLIIKAESGLLTNKDLAD